MRNKLIYILTLAWIFSACADELEQFPKDALTVPTTFTSYNNFKTYMWGYYSVFGDYHRGRFDRNEHKADLMVLGKNTNGNDWLWNRVVVPTSDQDYSNAYENVRGINLMLEHIPTSNLQDAEKEHWKSVGYFFRAYNYYMLLKKFGEVPIVDKYITDDDEDYLYAAKATRDELTTFILKDLEYAELNIKADGDGRNTINKNVVRALISRFGLFEGTWRKYHALSGAETYLNASAKYSKLLIDQNTPLHSNYDELYNNLSLKDVPEVLLYKEYLFEQHVHNTTQWMRSSESHHWDMTKAAADMFLCDDGKTIANSDKYGGDKDPYNEFRNRDHRMYFILTPPYQVEVPNVGKKEIWDYTDNPKHREYIDLMETLSGEKFKRLPENNWAGFVQPIAPNYRDANTQDIPFDPGYNITATGYKFWKWYNNHNIAIGWKDECDQPVFRMGEILVNYAEAKFELDEFDQAVADLTINKLRNRARVANMTVSEIDASFDPKRVASVSPVLWEIRRERSVELMGDGFRYDDLRRWKLMNELAAKEKLGRWIVANDHNNNLPVQGGAEEGYISRIGVPPVFPDYYYLAPLPSNELVLNKELKQNKGWEKK